MNIQINGISKLKHLLTEMLFLWIKINKMKTHIKYPKILQFRNVVTAINRVITFKGLDKDGNEIYDPSIKKDKYVKKDYYEKIK